MTCPTYGVLLSRSLDGEIDAAEKLALERHLSECDECRRTMNSWGLQKSHLRAFFARHSLDESFVRRARLARETRNLANSPAGRGGFSRIRFVSLRVAAGMLLAVLLLTHFSPKSDTDAFARVLTAGARLQVRSTPSSGWTPASLGATLRPGDWVHNPEQGIAELLLNGSAKITLQQGATAQLLRGAGNKGNEVVLVGGSIRAEKWDTGRVLQIHTSAGEIRSRGGEFVARVGETLLPQFEVNPDRSERLSGFVQVIAGVTVSRGSVEVVSRAGRQDVEPGAAALFTSSHPIVIGSVDATPGNIEVSLHPVSSARASGGTLVSRLVSSERGLRLAIEADQLPLPRLIALTTHTGVEGGEGLLVSGKLSYPPDSSPAELVAAIGAGTGLEISLRREQARREVVLSFAEDAQARASKGPRGFTVSRTADRRLSFTFQEVSAREAFGALRSAGVDLPQLSSESERTLLTFEAELLKPSDVRSWLVDQLRWQSLESDAAIEFVEINTPRSSSGNQTGSKVAEDLRSGTSCIASTSKQSEEAAMALSQGQAARQNSLSSGGIGAGLMLNPRQATVFLPKPSFIPNPGAPKVETEIAKPQSKGAVSVVTAKSDGNGLSVTVKVSRKSGQSVEETPPKADFPVGPRRVVWPVIGPSGGLEPAEAYSIYNPSSQPANTTWQGYDSAGRLLVTFNLEIGTKSSALLLPSSLSGELDPGSHWETASNVPISGSVVDPSGAGSRYDGIYPERLPPLWEFRASDFAGMGGSSRLWLINPGENPARGLLAIVEDDRVLFAQELSLDPHAGTIWSMESLFALFPEASQLRPGAQILVQATEGSIAAGSAAAPPPQPANPGEKARIIDSLFGH